MFAQVVIDISHEKLDRTFTYRIPPSLEGTLREGMVVSVPFGNGNQVRTGYVVGFQDSSDYAPEKIKDIWKADTTEETTESRLVALAAWMKENYGSTMIQALKTVLPIRDKVKDKEEKTLRLIMPRKRAESYLAEFRSGRAKARARILEALLASPDGKLSWHTAVSEYGATRAVTIFFEEKGIARLETSRIYRTVTKSEPLPEGKAVLNREQERAAAMIREEWKTSGRPVLLLGVTGSGKTQIYMEMIEETLAKGKQAIVLIPEIALTYQTVKRFSARFGDQVSVINSRLSAGERYDQFRRAKNGEVNIIVGPRSALFAPFDRLGLIVIDEEHEGAYRSEKSPCYQAREVALRLADMTGAHVLLGSATPSLESYHMAEEEKMLLVKLSTRYEERQLPAVRIVDMREELKQGNRSMFCKWLQEEMKHRLEQKEQIMLFLNRRGYAGFVSCRSCGEVMKCPHCDVSLSLHNNGRLICHYCGYEILSPSECPSCGSPFIGGFKAGTQQIETAVKKMFPKARVLRMDFDTTRTKGSYDEILESFSRHEADILIGTQMIVKGHDFPDVTLVGALAADLSLNEADYRCGEKTYQLLCQAVGRAGRGSKPGTAVIQTYHPEHYSILAAARQDYEMFYSEEMTYRQLMNYPPRAAMLAVRGSASDEQQLETAMHYLSEFLRRIQTGEEIPQIIGPAPESISKIRDIYRRVFHVKHSDRETLVHLKNMAEKYIRMNRGFQNITIQFDFTS